MGELTGKHFSSILWGNLPGTVNPACYSRIYQEADFQECYGVIYREKQIQLVMGKFTGSNVRAVCCGGIRREAVFQQRYGVIYWEQ